MVDLVSAGGFGAAVRRKEAHDAPWLHPTEVSRVHWTDPAVAGFLRRHEPVVLTGGCPLAAALRHWCITFLAEAEETCGEPSAWPVHFTPRAVRGVWRAYGKGLGEGGVREMSLTDFAAAASEGQRSGPAISFNLYLQALLVWACGPGKHQKRDNLGRRLEAELDTVDWQWLREACEQAGEGTFEACQLWASHGGVHTPCHYDSASNFVAQLKGRKRFLLFSPSQSFNLYAYPVGHPMDNFALPDVAQPDEVHRFPALASLRGLVTELAEGEVLWLPRFWWHHVEQPIDDAETCASDVLSIVPLPTAICDTHQRRVTTCHTTGSASIFGWAQLPAVLSRTRYVARAAVLVQRSLVSLVVR